MSSRPLVCLAGIHPMAGANLSARGHCLRCAADKRRAARAAGRPALAVLRPPAWMDDAACSGSDPEAWFPAPGGSAALCKRVCSACPVRAECLDYALAHKVPDGIWGGMSPDERRAEARRRASASAA